MHRPPAQVAASMARLKDLGVDRVRLTANWSVLTRDTEAQQPPAFDAADPAAYEQARCAASTARSSLPTRPGLDVLMDIGFWGPHWATDDPPGPRARTDVERPWRDGTAHQPRALPANAGRGRARGAGGAPGRRAADRQHVECRPSARLGCGPAAALPAGARLRRSRPAAAAHPCLRALQAHRRRRVGPPTPTRATAAWTCRRARTAPTTWASPSSGSSPRSSTRWPTGAASLPACAAST